MQTPIYNTGAKRYCAHGALENRCESTVTPLCPHVDVRPLAVQLFGRGGSNSQKAALIAHTNPGLYKQTQEEARELKLQPKLNTPAMPARSTIKFPLVQIKGRLLISGSATPMYGVSGR